MSQNTLWKPSLMSVTDWVKILLKGMTHDSELSLFSEKPPEGVIRFWTFPMISLQSYWKNRLNLRSLISPYLCSCRHDNRYPCECFMAITSECLRTFMEINLNFNVTGMSLNFHGNHTWIYLKCLKCHGNPIWNPFWESDRNVHLEQSRFCLAVYWNFWKKSLYSGNLSKVLPNLSEIKPCTN